MNQAHQDELRLFSAMILVQELQSAQGQSKGRSEYKRDGMAHTGDGCPRRPQCRGQQPPPPATLPGLCLAPGLLGEPR